MGGWGTDRNDARAEFDSDRDIVVRREAAFAEADGELAGWLADALAGGAGYLTLDLPQPESPSETILAM